MNPPSTPLFFHHAMMIVLKKREKNTSCEEKCVAEKERRNQYARKNIEMGQARDWAGIVRPVI
jgi:hypothetical protein